ncbi:MULTISPECIES: hypothetical protein [Streptomyces]|uniref:hypothetical protein n=1 Tax=Streptomyces TaxID=1883 RepID=UPI001E2F637D|nr:MULTISPECIES: hypothetical protein [Streptomyces]UFQ14255.1 hypothetical protein J2N69_04035 [Streptomyces huasconensis]WCL83854.1 hypothetical protein PPN52_04020 [Streptomyces sp. JCM 35825]
MGRERLAGHLESVLGEKVTRAQATGPADAAAAVVLLTLGRPAPRRSPGLTGCPLCLRADRPPALPPDRTGRPYSPGSTPDHHAWRTPAPLPAV